MRHHPSSFRDPSGHIFIKNNIIYRSIAKEYKEHWDFFIQSGLYQRLVSEQLLVSSKETTLRVKDAYKVIRPEPIPFISYPYEWSFSQLKDAALVTLKIQKIALEYGMILKDANCYNIQFLNGKPILIDSLSFEKYQENEPWIAYQQYCMFFLAPLLLMKYKSVDLNRLLQVYLDGIPLPLCSSLLPWYTWLKPSIFMNIHLHANLQKTFQSKQSQKKSRVTKLGLIGLINNLESLTKHISLNIKESTWINYYQETNYNDKAFQAKQKIVKNLLKIVKPKKVWDLGANTGLFSYLALEAGARSVISFDFDPLTVEYNYLTCKQKAIDTCLPLQLDLTNPSPAIGWSNTERSSLKDRSSADTILALALVHHLAITNNIPFDYMARFFSELGSNLIVEYVPKADSQAQRLLSRKKDIFELYTEEEFTKNFSSYYRIIKRVPIPNTKRVIYLMRKKK
jgi:hypothetical protein